MPNEDAGDKTEQPTPRRRQEAREEGQVARSQDLTAAVSLVAALVLLKTLGPQMLDTMLAMTRSIGQTPDVSGRSIVEWIRAMAFDAGRMLVPFLFFIVLFTAGANVAQAGLLLTWKKLNLKPERLNPVEGAKKMLSMDALTRLAVGLLKVAFISAIAWFTIANRMNTVVGAGGAATGGIFVLGSDLMFELALKMGLALLVLGLLDYFIQRQKLERQLRMTKQEVRDELKRMEGDPLLKHRRRQLQQRLAMQRISAEVPKADVVVTNPTEFAVALRYDQQAMTAPRVVAKGRGFLALRIRQTAQQHGVPVVERPPLARALCAGVEVGQEVPPQFYRAVAELLAYVYQLSGRAAG